MSSAAGKKDSNDRWLDELRDLGKDLNIKDHSDLDDETKEKRYETALYNVEVHQEELRAQNEELNLARENAEDALKKFLFLFENSPVGYFTIDERRAIEEVNYTGVSMLGLDRIHLIEKPFFLFVAPKSRATLESHFRAVFAGHRPTDEIIVLRSKGESFPVIIESCPAQNESSRDKRCLTIIFDITERKKSESDLKIANVNLESARREAEQSSNAKTDFISVMSHELRTPLNAILGFSEIIKGRIFGSDDINKYSEYGLDIFNSGQHLLTLVNDILDISKIESGEVEIRQSSLDMTEIFDECANIYGTQANEKELSLQFETSDNSQPLYADRRAVLQMMFNLISNSIQYTPSGGNIIVKAKGMNGRGHEITVTDTGIGIADDQLLEVTKPFGKTDTPHVPREHGTGLGLSITKGLIELHGGNIHIKSEENVGTTVSLVFPSNEKRAGR